MILTGDLDKGLEDLEEDRERSLKRVIAALK